MAQVAVDEQIDVYYLDMSNITDELKEYVMSLNLSIPFKCSQANNKTLKDGFGTPLTLIVEDNKTIDCFEGYINVDGFKSVLKNNKIKKN